MALRIRRDGRVLCAAMHPAEDGDTYLDDGLHYVLSVELRVLRPLPHGAWEFGPRGCHDLDDAGACDAHNAVVPGAPTKHKYARPSDPSAMTTTEACAATLYVAGHAARETEMLRRALRTVADLLVAGRPLEAQRRAEEALRGDGA